MKAITGFFQAATVCLALCLFQQAHAEGSEASVVLSRSPGASDSTLGPTPLPGLVDAALSKLTACYDRAFARLGKATADIDTLKQVSEFCHNESGYAYNQTEWEVRRGAYEQSQTQSDAILRLVEGMTWGGIALAALQLAFVFALSWRERKLLTDASEFTAESSKEASKLYFKSSLAGLMILVITFFFFYLYIRYVYPVTDGSSAGGSSKPQAEMGRVDTGSTPAAAVESGMGRLDDPGSPASSSPGMGQLDPSAAPGPAASGVQSPGPPHKKGMKHRANHHVNAAQTACPCANQRQE
ncbi:hypothetical protein [Paraburkholderia sp. RL17-347-BIC-D]|uniref:hypothetical protein n=1 Tax=Paraburkholderia sp. RL17-347-BIC-D TaxID=3031632 RepID=UPI0038B72563